LSCKILNLSHVLLFPFTLQSPAGVSPFLLILLFPPRRVVPHWPMLPPCTYTCDAFYFLGGDFESILGPLSSVFFLTSFYSSYPTLFFVLCDALQWELQKYLFQNLGFCV
jgi:hypothetical protein